MALADILQALAGGAKTGFAIHQQEEQEKKAKSERDREFAQRKKDRERQERLLQLQEEAAGREGKAFARGEQDRERLLSDQENIAAILLRERPDLYDSQEEALSFVRANRVTLDDLEQPTGYTFEQLTANGVEEEAARQILTAPAREQDRLVNLYFNRNPVFRPPDPSRDPPERALSEAQLVGIYGVNPTQAAQIAQMSPSAQKQVLADLGLSSFGGGYGGIDAPLPGAGGAGVGEPGPRLPNPRAPNPEFLHEAITRGGLEPTPGVQPPTPPESPLPIAPVDFAGASQSAQESPLSQLLPDPTPFGEVGTPRIPRDPELIRRLLGGR